ncbi:Alpha/beta hydrolase family protein [Desulfacinum hydrothermale DSM 13146]|uniref:Alpha/beta hydrolase family protein n=1 Tax=Desulfacinum hydrothermale DSM 13146 TaxID=1121390 RepID=A0A1W1XH48_9BACT|nr:alpha/beta fold hydrolase [Desulfacinum hydrothermale]SMC22838.1 Alpha/beta hydrolase family protein [Desulfacinum hydrothermale DSM 13146]
MFFGLVILSLFLGASCLTYLLYWYDTANGAGLERLRHLSGGHPGRWILTGILTGTMAQILLVLAFPTAWFGKKHSRPKLDPEASEPVIFLVHGLYHNRSAWWLLRRRLVRAGFRDVVTFEYSSWKRDFQGIAAQLIQSVQQVHTQAPQRPLVLVGHSLGGLLCRAAARRLSGLPIGGIVTLGSPHQGSRLAVFAFGRLGRSLRYRGPLIQGLQGDDPSVPYPRIALASPVDNMVLPMEALVPVDDHWQLEWTQPVSHVAMLYHPGVLSRVLASIDHCRKPEKES